jgi:hypothetical protein
MSTISPSAAQRLIFELKQLGGTAPAPLNQLLDLIESVKTAPTPADPAAALVDAAIASKPQDLAKLVSTAARAENEAEYWRRLQVSVARTAMARFAQELRNGGADHFLDSLRPELDEVAEQIAAAKEVVDISWTPDQLVAEGTPEQLAAWQQLPALVARVDRIAALVVGFGRHGDFAVLEQPQHLVHNELIGLRDEALFLTDSDPWRASDLVNARRAAWQTSPWLRMSLRLNTVDEARERLRAQCEYAFDAMESRRGESGRLTDNGFVRDPKRANPFALPEPAAVEAATPDDVDAVAV